MLQVTLPHTILVVFQSAFDLAWDRKFSLPISAPISTTPLMLLSAATNGVAQGMSNML